MQSKTPLDKEPWDILQEETKPLPTQGRIQEFLKGGVVHYCSNFNANGVVEVKQLCKKQFYSIIFRKNQTK